MVGVVSCPLIEVRCTVGVVTNFREELLLGSHLAQCPLSIKFVHFLEAPLSEVPLCTL